MANKTNKSVANSLETDEILLPHMPYLLQDLWVLGSSVQPILDNITSLNLPAEETTVLDLGCGKGGVSVQIAARFGFRTTGIDLMEPFLVVAREKAKQYHVSHLCKFFLQDIYEYVKTEHTFDLVILASLGGVLGNLRETVSRLRSQIKPGGFVLLDDGYLKHGRYSKRKGYMHYRDHDTTVKELTFYRDRLIREESTTDLSKDINAEYLDIIKKRGKELAERHPQLKKDIEAYIDYQREECEFLDNQIEGELWLLQKAD